MVQIEIDVEDLAKAKKKVWVKPTATKKGHYREMEVGRKEEEGISDKTKLKDMSEKDIPKDIKESFNRLCRGLDTVSLSREEIKSVNESGLISEFKGLKMMDLLIDKVTNRANVPSSKNLKNAIRMTVDLDSPEGITSYYDGTFGDLKRDLGINK